MSTLMRRALTAVVFVGVMFGGLYGGRYSFLILFGLITGLCVWEFLGLVLPDRNYSSDGWRKLLGLFVGIIPFLLVSLYKLNLFRSDLTFIKASAAIIAPSIFLVFLYELFAKSDKPFSNIAYIGTGLLYIGLPFALLPFITIVNGQYYMNIPLGLLLLIWMNDSGAYLVGSRIGKTPLFPRISPNKTWEGTMGGVLLSLTLAFVLSLLFSELSLKEWMITALIVVIFGSLGDLVESMLKRSLGIKDSGNLLPGHEGFLDRFDAFIFLLPFVVVYLLWIQY